MNDEYRPRMTLPRKGKVDAHCYIACLKKEIPQVVAYDYFYDQDANEIPRKLLNFQNQPSDNMIIKISSDCRMILFVNGQMNYIIEDFGDFYI